MRELYRALPPADEDPDAVAVIIGNRSYDKLPRSVTSYNDADAIYSFLTEHLGYRPDNIIDLGMPRRPIFERVFGAEPGFEGELARLVQSQPNAKVLVYYSGHGATDGAQNETYLLPVETEPYREEASGYKLSTLYANLAGLDVKSVLVLLETEYGRGPRRPCAAAEPARDEAERAAAGAGAGAHRARRLRSRAAHADRPDLRYRPVHALCDRGTCRRRRSSSGRQRRRRGSTAPRSMCLPRRSSISRRARRSACSSNRSILAPPRAWSPAHGARRRGPSRACTAPAADSRIAGQIIGGARENRFTRGQGFHTGPAGSEAISLEGSTDIGNLVWE